MTAYELQFPQAIPLLSMNDLQIRIIRELVSPDSLRWDIRESYAAMAEKLKVNEETVRRGVNRARKNGFLRSVQLVLNPDVLGCESAGIQIEVDDSQRKSAVISQVEQLGGVIIIADFIGKSLRATFYYRDEHDPASTAERISTICSSKDVRIAKVEFPLCSLRLQSIDWRIIWALRKVPRRQVSEVADEVGVSRKTIHRRLKAMIQNKTFFLVPEISFDKYRGVASSVLVTVQDQRRKVWVDTQIRGKLEGVIYANTFRNTSSLFTILCMNVSEADEIQRWIRGLKGVGSVRMDYIKEIKTPREWLNQEIERHVARSPGKNHPVS